MVCKFCITGIPKGGLSKTIWGFFFSEIFINFIFEFQYYGSKWNENSEIGVFPGPTLWVLGPVLPKKRKYPKPISDLWTGCIKTRNSTSKSHRLGVTPRSLLLDFFKFIFMTLNGIYFGLIHFINYLYFNLDPLRVLEYTKAIIQIHCVKILKVSTG